MPSRSRSNKSDSGADSSPAPSVKYRFKVKPLKNGNKTVWGVYDMETGSYPLNRKLTGPVEQDHATEALAKVEVDRLESIYRPQPVETEAKTKKKTVRRKQ